MVWFEFALCVVVITAAGVRLCRYGDAIADKTGLGGTWVGIVMLASVTSLPELVTGISAVTLADVPEIAVGDVLGSCVFNLVIIVILDSLYRQDSVYRRASQGHVLSAAFGVVLIGFTGFSLLLPSKGFNPVIAHIGLYTPVILVLYAVAIRTVFRYERSRMAKFARMEEDQYPETTLNRAIAQYVAAAVFVLAAGSYLPYIGEAMAELMGWNESFVGTLFVAFATSLPEIVVTIAALKLGAVNMAIGNLFGSNLFNIAILAVDDLLYVKGPLFESVSATHAVSAISAVMMTGIAIVGLYYRSRTRVLNLVGWVSIFLFLVYMMNTFVMYLYGS
ncbi:MAG: sodium:calcium antiporter [Proteobacteria bacterium]|nr:MAG: sodium:calcium antiporter [Pseudomonadota bacterium]